MFKKIPILLIAAMFFLTGCFTEAGHNTIPEPLDSIGSQIEARNDKDSSEKAPPSNPVGEKEKPAQDLEENDGEGSEVPAPVKQPDTNTGSGTLVVEFIDVGQGDSILIITPSGKSILIDAGDKGNGEIIAGRIQANKVSRLDVVIASHPHADHIGSMATILNNFEIGQLYMPNATSTSKTFENLLYTIKGKGLGINIAQTGKRIDLDPAISLEFVSPGKEWNDTNNSSAVLKMVYGESSFLFTGDMESDAESSVSANIDVDVLKVGHHGSETSSTQAFLNRVTPNVSIISVGAGNKYDHPKISVIERLQNIGSQVYRTDISGTIRLESDGKDIRVVNAKPSPEVAVKPAPAQTPEPAPAPQPKPEPVPKPVPAPVPVPVPAPAPEKPVTENISVIITKTGKKYHLDGCSALRSRIETTLEDAKSRGLEPCSICNPPD